MSTAVTIRRVLLPVIILALGAAAAFALVNSRPDVETVDQPPPPPLVRVQTVAPQPLQLDVRAQGTVEPRDETTIVAQVAGVVVGVAPSFENGGFFAAGEPLVELDARDYVFRVQRAEAAVRRAEVVLAQQQAEADVARREWDALGGGGEPDPLVLREPQLAQARADQAAAEADLEQARLDLSRTRIAAPFDGRVRAKQVAVGQYVTPGTPIAVTHPVDVAEVRLPVPDDQLAYVDLPLRYEPGGFDGPRVDLDANFAGQRHRWTGRIVRTEGELDARSRMLTLVAQVRDPYSRGRASTATAPLPVGLFVDATITGRAVEGVTVLPRIALRQLDPPRGGARTGTVLVVENDRLQTRAVTLARVTGERIVVQDGLRAGERVCVSQLDVVTEGMAVRTTEVDGPSTGDDDAPVNTLDDPDGPMAIDAAAGGDA